jgi:hypothetical protein
VAPSLRKKLAITSPTSSSRSVGIVHSWTQTMEFSLVSVIMFKNYEENWGTSVSVLCMWQSDERAHSKVVCFLRLEQTFFPMLWHEENDVAWCIFYFPANLVSEHADKVIHHELRQQKLLRERQDAFGQAFQQDIQEFKLSGSLPSKYRLPMFWTYCRALLCSLCTKWMHNGEVMRFCLFHL